MATLPRTICPSQLQLQSTDDQSLAAIEARLVQGFFDEEFMTSLNNINPPSPPLPDLDLTDLSALPDAPDFFLEEDFFTTYDPATTFTNEDFPLPTPLPTADALAQSWEALFLQQSSEPPTDADIDYDALFSDSAAPVPLATAQAPATPESSTRRSSGDRLSERCAKVWDPAALLGYMTPPASRSGPGSMETDWEALFGAPTLAPAPAPTASPPTWTPLPAPASSTTASTPWTRTPPSPIYPNPATKPSAKPNPKAKAHATDRRERKTTRRRKEAARAGPPGSIVFAPNIVPPPGVYVSAYSHTREYCLDARGRVLKRRRYEDPVVGVVG